MTSSASFSALPTDGVIFLLTGYKYIVALYARDGRSRYFIGATGEMRNKQFILRL